jgi:hypothetical protein
VGNSLPLERRLLTPIDSPPCNKARCSSLASFTRQQEQAMRRQDKINMHDPKDAGVHAKKTKAPFPQPAKTTNAGDTAVENKNAGPAEPKATLKS